MDDPSDLKKFAERYAKAWCSRNPQAVVTFFAKNGSLSVNKWTARGWASGDCQGSASVHFDAAEYER